MYQFAKKYPLSVCCLALIWVLSLVPFFPETPLDDVEFIDKWVHIAMYDGTGLVLWGEYLRLHPTPDYRKLFIWAFCALIAMSGLLELLQEYCTFGHRNGDWLDLLANATGVALAAIIGLVAALVRSRISKVRDKKGETDTFLEGVNK